MFLVGAVAPADRHRACRRGVHRTPGCLRSLQRRFRAALNILDAQIGLLRVMIVLPDEDEPRLRVHSAVGLDRDQSQRAVEGNARLSDDQRILKMVATLLAQAIVLSRGSSAPPVRT